MSKCCRAIPLIFAALSFTSISVAQDLEVTIKIEGQTARVEGSFNNGLARSGPIVLLDEYAGVRGLAARFKSLSNKDAIHWSYDADLRPVGGQVAAAHVSWISGDVGLLLLDDLLPKEGHVSAHVTLNVPDGWTVVTSETVSGGGYDVHDIQKAVFVLGRELRKPSNNSLQLSIAGNWQFSDADASTMASEIYSSYQKLFSTAASIKPHVVILKFPQDIQPGQWEADTRGSTVTIVSSEATFKSQSLNRLHEQLRHEMFHLWFPNGANFSGNYDWFYEGFALYESLKLGLAVNQIRFEDYLGTLAAAYDVDRRIEKRRSLIESSRDRFGSGGLDVYARGLLVAFLADLAMLESTRGKVSTDDLVRGIYNVHSLTTPRVDGNETLVAMLRVRPDLLPIVDRYVTGSEPIDQPSLLANAGIETVENGRELALQVVKKPTARQKEILERLGYNNWRKVIPRQ